jgi:demethylmenaquinone methyltransferase / 2-methoxy-6-polyprenyl-1,4-benzoquinol methylase
MPTAPHAQLPEFYGSAEEREGWVEGLFDSAAPDYDRVSEAISFWRGRVYRREALIRAGLRTGMRVLDVATGTGLVAAAALEAGTAARDIVGIDPSRGMLMQNRSRRDVALVAGRGESLPFADRSFDFAVMGYALRHVADLAGLFGELRRVLHPGGRVLVLEISRPASRAAAGALRLYMKRLVPLATWLLTRRRASVRMMEYYWATIETCVPPASILGAMSEAGFADTAHTTTWGTLSDYLGVRP